MGSDIGGLTLPGQPWYAFVGSAPHSLRLRVRLVRIERDGRAKWISLNRDDASGMTAERSGLSHEGAGMVAGAGAAEGDERIKDFGNIARLRPGETLC